MWKKITLSISICLITIICFALMGSKVKANSIQSTKDEFYQYDKSHDINGLKKIGLVTQETYQNERVIWELAIHPFENGDAQVNNNYIPDGFYADIYSIAIETGYGGITIDVDEQNAYNEIILSFDFSAISSYNGYDYSDRGCNIQIVNNDLSNLNLDYITFYQATLWYEQGGSINKYVYNGTFVQPNSNSTNMTLNSALYYLLVYLQVNNYIPTTTDIYNICFTDIVIGYASEQPFKQVLITDIEYIENNPITDYFRPIPNEFNLWTSFLYPTLNSFLNTDLILGISISSIIGLAIAIPMTIWLLKIYFGG